MEREKFKTNETPLEDLKRDALKLYNEGATAIHHWSSFIEKCIKEYHPVGYGREKIIEVLNKIGTQKEWTKYHPIYYSKEDCADEIIAQFDLKERDCENCDEPIPCNLECEQEQPERKMTFQKLDKKGLIDKSYVAMDKVNEICDKAKRKMAEKILETVMVENNFIYVSFPAFVENENSVDVFDIACKAIEACQSQFTLPVTDEEIEKQFPYARSLTDYGAQIGAKWLRSRLQPAIAYNIGLQSYEKLTDEQIIDYALNYVSHKSLKTANKGLIKDALIIGAKAVRDGQIAEWVKQNKE